MTVKKFATIFALTLAIGALAICIYLMVYYINQDKAEQEAAKNRVLAEVTPEPTAIPSPSPTPEPTPTPESEEPDYMSMFYFEEINDEVAARIKGKSYAEDAEIPLSDLRYCHVMHYGFDNNVHEGELIVNLAIADDVIDIFKELFKIEYPIEKIRLIDEYDASDEASMSDNNSSAFNYRFISGTTTLSNHALGLAIDINPRYNPYVYTNKKGETVVEPANGQPYVNRSSTARYFIQKNDEIYCIFLSHGFTWGGDWETKKDYQHFEKELS